MSDRYPDDDCLDWYEGHGCPECGGDGAAPDDGYGERPCRACGGCGVDPDHDYDPGPEG